MTPEERQMLTDLANKVAQTPPPPVDKEAEEFIRTRIGSRPDALYLMTQTVLIQNMALDQARQQIQQLQQPAAQGSSSFLGGGPSGFRGAPAAQAQTYAGQQAPPPQAYQLTQGGGAPSGSGAGGFLRGAAQTAAGVAAGALAFEGIRSMFGGLEHLGGLGGPQYGSGFMGGAPEETVINNYYDSPDANTRDDFQASNDDRFLGNDSLADDTTQGSDDVADSGDDYDDNSGGDFLA